VTRAPARHNSRAALSSRQKRNAPPAQNPRTENQIRHFPCAIASCPSRAALSSRQTRSATEEIEDATSAPARDAPPRSPRSPSETSSCFALAHLASLAVRLAHPFVASPMPPNVPVRPFEMSRDVPACPHMSPISRPRKTNPPQVTSAPERDAQPRRCRATSRNPMQPHATLCNPAFPRHAIWQNEPTVSKIQPIHLSHKHLQHIAPSLQLVRHSFMM
jgi:hypothetical protein